MKKVRLDVLLTERGVYSSREAARRAIMAGEVRRNTEIMDKAGTFVSADDTFEIERPKHRYVGRGGLKLERALQRFGVEVRQRVVLDVGASTGGFTDCALQHGARQVYAVDVGYGQLAWKLRNDERVVVMERTNFRYVEKETFQPVPTLAVMDVSFISTRLLLPKLQEVLGAPKDIVSLVKPQFEAGRGKVGKGGIVRNPEIHREVLETLVGFAYSRGLVCKGLDFSPITGGDGNIEYLAWWQETSQEESLPAQAWQESINELVAEAWQKVRGAETDIKRECSGAKMQE